MNEKWTWVDSVFWAGILGWFLLILCVIAGVKISPYMQDREGPAVEER